MALRAGHPAPSCHSNPAARAQDIPHHSAPSRTILLRANSHHPAPSRTILLRANSTQSNQNNKSKYINKFLFLSPYVPLLRYGDKDSISTLTFEHSVAYIAMCDPKCFILEMIWSKKIREEFLRQLWRVCPHYALWSGVINSMEVAPTSRTRFYTVGINVCKVAICRNVIKYNFSP